jgi:cellobiose-specific phosphotransferase system component IIB
MPYVLRSDDIDIVMIGPQATLYIKNIDSTESAQGIYYIKYKRYMVG